MKHSLIIASDGKAKRKRLIIFKGRSLGTTTMSIALKNYFNSQDTKVIYAVVL
jgi:hypothetical protein